MRIFFLTLCFYTVCSGNQNPVANFNLAAIFRTHPAMARFCPELGVFYRGHIPPADYNLIRQSALIKLQKLYENTAQKYTKLQEKLISSANNLKEQNLQMNKSAFTGIENIYNHYIKNIILLYREYMQEREKLLSAHFSRPDETQEACKIILTDIQNKLDDLAFHQGVALILQSPESQHNMQILTKREHWFTEKILPAAKELLPAAYHPPIKNSENIIDEDFILWQLLIRQTTNLKNTRAFQSVSFADLFTNGSNSESR